MAEHQGITRHERRGVPVLSMPPRDGLYRGGIVFRAGIADESLPQRGVCHLIEHVVADVSASAVNSNAQTQDLFTSFYAWGTPGAVHRYLETICQQLRELPRDRLERERRILTVENLAPGGAGTPGRLKYLRCGNTGFGACCENEHGIWNMSDHAIAEWCAEYFTTQNCVAYLTGDPPDELDLALPEGVRKPPPELRRVPHLITPAQAEDAFEEVALGAVASVGSARDIVMDVVCSRVVAHLRAERGVIYDVQTSTEPIDSERSHCCFYVDVFDSDAAVVRNTIFQALSDLAADGATLEERQRFSRDCQEYASSFEPAGELDDAAEDALIGRQAESPAQYNARLATTTEADISRAAREMIDSAIVSVPEGTPLPTWPESRVKRIGHPEFPPVDGVDIPGRRRMFGLRKGNLAMVVGATSAGAYDENTPEWVSLRYEQAVLATRHASGDLTLLRGDGYWIRFDAARERQATAIADVLEKLDPAVLIDSPHRVQVRRLREAADERVSTSELFQAAAANAAEELTATESIHHVVRAQWGDHKGLMVVTDRRIVLGGAEDDQFGSRPLSDFKEARHDGELVLVEAEDGSATTFTIEPFDQIGPIVATVTSLLSTTEIALF